MAEGDAPDTSEKTEDPTHKRLDEALKRGDVVKSQEVNTWFIIAGGTLVLSAFAGSMGTALTATGTTSARHAPVFARHAGGV